MDAAKRKPAEIAIKITLMLRFHKETGFYFLFILFFQNISRYFY